MLDPILEAYVEEDLGREQLVRMGFAAEDVERVIRLVDLAEYKRRQARPGIKITPQAFGRDRRMPITNRYRGSGRGARGASRRAAPAAPRSSSAPGAQRRPGRR